VLCIQEVAIFQIARTSHDVQIPAQMQMTFLIKRMMKMHMKKILMNSITRMTIGPAGGGTQALGRHHRGNIIVEDRTLANPITVNHPLITRNETTDNTAIVHKTACKEFQQNKL
jgi:hypothetical protein